jgi:hypothetical protein
MSLPLHAGLLLAVASQIASAGTKADIPLRHCPSRFNSENSKLCPCQKQLPLRAHPSVGVIFTESKVPDHKIQEETDREADRIHPEHVFIFEERGYGASANGT